MAAQLETGFALMLAGVGTVYLLLALLVWIVKGVSKMSRWLDARATPAAAQPPGAATAPADDAELVGVIGAALQAHRRRRESRAASK